MATKVTISFSKSGDLLTASEVMVASLCMAPTTHCILLPTPEHYPSTLDQ